MCGIIGIFSTRPKGNEAKNIASGMTSMKYRGPSGEGVLDYDCPVGKLVLGHKRLAIIDLSDAGRQPMVSPDGRFSITFNGEIYNYIELREKLKHEGVIFNTATDSEVLLAAWSRWGERCLSMLDGMFAFAVHDRVEQSLCCVVDPFGIKPFYYSADDEGFCFASEIPALMSARGRSSALDLQSSVSYLLWGGHDVGESTFISDVLRLPPGHMLKLSLVGNELPRVGRWWNPSIEEDQNISFQEAAEKLRSIFLSSVSRQLRSDVPIGFALSGGLDSSAIVCAARYLEPDYPIRTFSYLASKESLNERKWADVVNQYVGAAPHWISDTDDGFDLDAAMLSQGEPFGSTSILAGSHVFQRMHREGIVVSLDGQGADEALGGYDGYPLAILREYLDKRNPLSAIRFLIRWSNWPGRGNKALARVLGDAFLPRKLRKFGVKLAGYDTTPSWLDLGALENAGIEIGVPDRVQQHAENFKRRLSERLKIALTEEGLPRLLRYADRNSMKFSIESRVPFLTPELTSFMLTMPMEYIVSPQGETKYLFREAMRGIVPDAILERKDKIGFQTPERDLLLANRSMIESWIESSNEISFLNGDDLKSTINAYLDGKIPYKSRCWRLVNFCRWRSLMGDKIC